MDTPYVGMGAGVNGTLEGNGLETLSWALEEAFWVYTGAYINGDGFGAGLGSWREEYFDPDYDS